jgi:hypothetical protein
VAAQSRPEHHPHLLSAPPARARVRSPWPAWDERPAHAIAAAIVAARESHRPQPQIEPLASDPADPWPTLPEADPDAGWEAARLERRLARARMLRTEQRGI